MHHMHQHIRKIHETVRAMPAMNLRRRNRAEGGRTSRAARRLDLRHKRLMKVSQILRCVMASILGLPAGCDPGDEVEAEAEFAGEVEFRPIGGVWLNTSSIGPVLFSALDLDGQQLDGMTLTDVLIKRPGGQWLRMDTVDVHSGQIRGKRQATYYTGADLVGSRWLLTPAQGAPVEMWIASYSVISATETRYTFQTLDPDGAPIHVCDPSIQGDYSAIPIKDITIDHTTGAMAARERTLYLACVSGAVGKARTWGYGLGTLASFEAAVRMVRADYCYDGASWTITGTAVQVQDDYDINGFLHGQYPTEGVWTTGGLACLGQPRSKAFTAGQVICGGAAVPTCPANLDMATYPGALYWTKAGTL